MSRSRHRRERLEEWKPLTKLGRLVLEGKISSLEEAFGEGLKIRESEIVDLLLPNLEEEVINVNLVQKQTDAGEKSRFKAIVAIGNRDGYLGLGAAKARQVRTAIEKGATDARLNVTIIRRGCGSWECRCGQPHSLPFETVGRRGSVKVKIIPGPRGLGLVASEGVKAILRLAGIKDCWTRSYGSTRTVSSFSYAVFDALKKTYEVVTPTDWV
ncbi:MAG: 30S ribosomal protein S5 [Candidatus Bathyarchaeota archaeon]|nr:30S ribosomal protein S5 [Candidatus Bathyarchaeota archaeon]